MKETAGVDVITTVVTKDVPDYALVRGVPARLAGWVCECGAKPEFTSDHGTWPVYGTQYRRVADDQVAREAE